MESTCLKIKRKFRLSGYSWGLNYSVRCWKDDLLKAWIVWDATTGIVRKIFPYEVNRHGHDFARMKAMRYAEPDNYYMNPAEQDKVS